MAATTTELGLVTPTQGDLTGTWGNVVNNGITEYTNIAIAGTTTFNGDGAVTLVNTTGNASATGITSTSAQYAIVRVTGTLTTTKVITFGSAGSPPYSKLYLVDNAATGGSVNFVPYGGSGVTLAVGEKAFVYYNGTNIVQLTGVSSTGVVPITQGGTGSSTAPGAYANILGFTTTATAAGTTTLTNTSTVYQQFTGSSNQTVQLPVTSTLQQGWSFHIVNNSTGTLSVVSSGLNSVISVPSQTTAMCTCIATGGTGATDWESGLTDFSAVTGTGSVVLNTSAVLVSPNLGTVATGNVGACTVDGTNLVGYKAIPQSGSAKTGSYTLATTDVGEFIEIGTGGSIVVPNSTFSAGDAVVIFNNTSGAITLTMSITTAYIGGTDSDKATISLATRGICNVLFISGTVCVVTGNVT